MNTQAVPTLLRADSADRHGRTARALQRDCVAGRLVRIRAGVYASAAEWQGATHDARSLARIAAVIGSRRAPPILFGPSAAIVLGLPLIGGAPRDVHLLAGTRSAPPNGEGVVWHRDAVSPDSIVEVNGFLVTDVHRTLFDLARSTTFLRAMPALDRGVRPSMETAPVRLVDRQVACARSASVPGTTVEGLLDEIAGRGPRRGVRRAARAVAFADARAESVGESLSRAQMHLFGFPAPELQVAFERAQGGHDIVDFDWPDFGLSGEFDGKTKYVREELRDGRSIEDVVWAERQRERRIIRRHRRTFARWVWSDALHGSGLRDELLGAGLPIVRRGALA